MMITTDELIQRYCAWRGITRQQYEAEGTLRQENIDALVELRESEDDDPVIPVGLPGAGKRRSEISEDDTESLRYLEVEFDDLLAESESSRELRKK